MIHAQRLEKLAAELSQRGTDAIFIGPSTDLEYLANLKMHEDERTKGLMVSSRGDCFALCPLLYRQEMQEALGDGVAYEVWADHEGFRGAFRSGCETLGLAGKTIAVNDGVLAVDVLDMMDALPGKYVNGAHLLSPLRMQKDGTELSLMRRASEIADTVMDDLAGFMKKGMVEAEIKEYLIKQFEKRGGDGAAFSPIVASGSGGAMPHYNRSDRALQDGDFVIVDMGCKYEGYCSDMTRTFCIGTPTEEQRKVYEIVLEAQKAGEAAVRPDVTGQDVDRAARKVIEDAGYGQNFLNRLGHGIGIAVHEGPYIIEGNDVPLRPGNVFSIEPGIYLPGKFGVRIENLVTVRSDGTGEALNKLTRDLIEIK